MLIIDSCPDALPDDVGANINTNVADLPAANVSGRERLLTLKPALIVSLLMVIEVVPLFVRVTVIAFELPTGTLWKLGLAGVSASGWVWASAGVTVEHNRPRANAYKIRRLQYWGKVRIYPQVCLMGVL